MMATGVLRPPSPNPLGRSLTGRVLLQLTHHCVAARRMRAPPRSAPAAHHQPFVDETLVNERCRNDGIHHHRVRLTTGPWSAPAAHPPASILNRSRPCAPRASAGGARWALRPAEPPRHPPRAPAVPPAALPAALPALPRLAQWLHLTTRRRSTRPSSELAQREARPPRRRKSRSASVGAIAAARS